MSAGLIAGMNDDLLDQFMYQLRSKFGDVAILPDDRHKLRYIVAFLISFINELLQFHVIEASFMRAVDVKATKRRLIQTILDNFDTSDENFDINTFRHINNMKTSLLKIRLKSHISPQENRCTSLCTAVFESLLTTYKMIL